MVNPARVPVVPESPSPHTAPTFLFCSTLPFSTMAGDGVGFRALLADMVRFNSGVRNEPCQKTRVERG